MTSGTKRLLSLLLAERRRLGLALALLSATAGFGIALLGTSAWLVARAALRPSIGALHVAIAGVRCFGLGRSISRYCERLVSHDVTLRGLGRLRAFLCERLAPLSPARLASTGSGDLLARVIADVEELDGVFLKWIGPISTAAVVVLGVTAFLASKHAGLAVVWLVAVAPGGLLAPALVLRFARTPGARLVQERGVLHARLADGVRGVADLVAFGRGPDHAEGLARIAAALDADERRVTHASAAGSALSSVSADLGALALVGLAIPLVRSGRIEGLQLAVLPLVALAAFEVVAPLAAAFRSRGGIEVAAKRVAELIDSPPAVVDPLHPETPGPAARIEARGLSFEYPDDGGLGAEEPVRRSPHGTGDGLRPAPEPDGTRALAELDLVLERGRLVALVGPSGSGKSTLIQLLLRSWEVEPGRLFLDGVDLRRLAAASVRERLAVATVRDHVFAGLLRENLGLAKADATESELWTALERAELAPWCRSLREGLDTWVGEHGVSLSGGERQRLVLARAFLREAPVLLLDEPTAHLDPEMADRVMRTVSEECRQRGKAVLVATHRLQGLEIADEIVVLNRGRVAERGSWEALLASAGDFARAVAEEQGDRAVESLGRMESWKREPSGPE